MPQYYNPDTGKPVATPATHGAGKQYYDPDTGKPISASVQDVPGAVPGMAEPGATARPTLSKVFNPQPAIDMVKSGQNAFDKLTSMTPHQMPHSASDVAREGVTALSNTGAGVISLATPVVHPLKTLAAIGGMLPPVAAYDDIAHAINPQHPQSVPAEMAQGIAEHPLESGEMLAGQILGGEGVGSTVRAIPKAMTKVSGKINDALIGTPAEGMHGAEPGLTMAKKGIIGSTPSSLTSSLKSVIPEVTKENRAIIASAPAGSKINTGPLISPVFQDEIASGVNPRTGAASPAQIGIAQRTMRQLTHVPDEMTGQVTPMMRDPNLSPLEAAHLKSNIYERTNYDPSGRYNIANSGLKGAAHNLKSAIEDAVPESIPSGHDLHSLVQAKEILDPVAARQLGVDVSKSGILNRIALGTGTRAAKLLYGAGEKVSPMANVIESGEIPAISSSVATTMKKKKEQ